MIHLLTNEITVNFVIPLVQEGVMKGESPVETGKKGLVALFVLILIPVVAGVGAAAWFIYKHTIGKKFQTTIIEDYRKEAEKHEKAGRFVSAAAVYESRLKDPQKAAELYEKGKDFKRAAEIYDLLGNAARAKELYEKSGSIRDAAEVSMMEGEFEEAAKLYDRAGQKLDAAEVMVRSGRKLAAVRIFREAGQYRRAAQLLEEEGMLREAAEMFGMSLAGKKPDTGSLGDFYSYAFKLEKAGLSEMALNVYRSIDAVDPAFRDVREKIGAAEPAPEEEQPPQGSSTLRSFIRSGRIEPKYGLKLWIQILRNLPDAYAKGHPCGMISPDSIAIDAQNNVKFIKRRPAAAYIPPETARGLDLDERADIYSAGIILYEMLSGSLEGLGSVRVIDVAEDVPEWLDEIVIRCIRKVREDRYQSIEEIFADLKTLSREKKG